jgi:hypothetical protein
VGFASSDPLCGRRIALVGLTSHLVAEPKSDMTASEKKNPPSLIIALTLLVGLGGGAAAILNALHRRAPALGAVEAYYTEFLMQR